MAFVIDQNYCNSDRESLSLLLRLRYCSEELRILRLSRRESLIFIFHDSSELFSSTLFKRLRD